MRDDWWGQKLYDVSKLLFFFDSKCVGTLRKKLSGVFLYFFLFQLLACVVVSCCALNLRLHSEAGRVGAVLFIGPVVTTPIAHGSWAAPRLAPPLFPNWIEHPHHLGSSLSLAGDRRRCRIQLRATRLRMRKSQKSLAACQIRNEIPPSSTVRLQSGRVSVTAMCVFINPLHFLAVFSSLSKLFLSWRFSFEFWTVFFLTFRILKFPTQKWVNCYFRCFFFFSIQPSAPRIVIYFNLITSYFLIFWLSYRI